MCEHHSLPPARAGDGENEAEGVQPFPWEIGVCDAHCHPTDTMPLVPNIGRMKARVLTIMATRAQDQELVASVATKQTVPSRLALASTAAESLTTSTLATGEERETTGNVIPAFGWHPWFSHMLYDDMTTAPGERTYNPKSEGEAHAEKTRHYATVLSSPEPAPELVASLPEPKPLSLLISETREYLLAHPLALVGEIGLDKAFRMPQAWSHVDESARDDELTPGGREGRHLSPHHVRMPHQVSILRAQLRLAGELGRPVSVHGVQAHGVLFDTVSALWRGHEKEVISKRQQKMVAPGAEDFSSDEGDENDEDDEGSGGAGDGRKKKTKKRDVPAKPFPPRICLHSYSGSPQTLKQWLAPTIPAEIFFSFSVVVNLSTAATEAKFPDVIRACPDDKLLVESDIHRAGDEMDDLLEQMYRRVCKIKGWELRDGVERIRRNYEAFIFG